ncbi:YolD-like family protein [Rummeliibacillus sp. NPDC094406]|uniref:YolD-like family protein n=1 Tax=Rummeliibacillus sp. NPDC094406 TaxID=3364511 RepID=UPI0038132AEE
MIRDRGNIKWTAMMLPEHVQRLRIWQQETQQIAKPAFDEWTLQALEEELMQAYYGKKEVLLEVWHQRASTQNRGVITELKGEEKKLCLYDTTQRTNNWIDVEVILHIKVLA